MMTRSSDKLGTSTWRTAEASLLTKLNDADMVYLRPSPGCKRILLRQAGSESLRLTEC